MSLFKDFLHRLNQGREEEQLSIMRQAIDGNPASIMITDISGNIEYVNKKFTDLTGYFPEEILGKNPRILKSGDQPVEYYESLWNTILSGREWSGEFHNKTKKGESYWVITSISPIKNKKAEITNFIAVIEDITYLKQIEENLRETEDINREILEAIPDIMFRMDKNGLVLDKILNKKLNEILPEEIKKEIIPYVEEAIKTFSVQLYEFPVLIKDEETHYEARFIASSESEVLVILRNITERVNAEKLLKKAESKAISANKAKSEFLANMSHEIRTPLNSIMGFIELLKNTSLDKRQNEYLDIISTSAANLVGIINDILDFSKIESGKIELDHVIFNPIVEFEPVIHLFNARAIAKNIELISFIDPRLPSAIIGDHLRIKQVIANLLSNATKFTPENGSIIIEIVLLEKREKDCVIHFAVQDTGIGIPDYKKQKIFEAFTQADGAITRKYGGTGLGLSISLNLVKLMGGELQLESYQGKGSTFYFDLSFPVEEDEKNPYKNIADGINVALLRPGPGKGLLAEVIKKYLQSFNYTVIIVNTVEEAQTKNNIALLVVILTIESLEQLSREKIINPILLVNDSLNTLDISSIEKNISRVIYSPINQSTLFNTIVDIVYPQAGERIKQKLTLNEMTTYYDADVLVAEDNEINQKLMHIMLNEIGIRVDIASNGLEVFDMYKQNPYDLVFMDINMPVSDGIEATQLILDYEKENKKKHTPIVALTAKAISGDREMLLKSGMDDYLSKPVSMERVQNILLKYIRHRVTGQRENGTGEIEDLFLHAVRQVNSGRGPLYDIEAVSHELRVPVDILSTIINSFLDNAEQDIKELEALIAIPDMEGIGRNAHKLKGASANIRFNDISAVALEIEQYAKDGKPINFLILLDRIKKMLFSYNVYFKNTKG